jgi:hypothetical protein
MTSMIMLAYVWDSVMVRWILGVLAGLFACYLALILLVARFERQQLRLLKPLAGRAPPRGAELIAEAERHGFRTLGTFSDGDKGFREGICSFLILDNGTVLLWILHSKLAGRHQLVSRVADGAWIITSSITASNDLSGLRREEILPDAAIGTMLHAHRRRIAELGEAIVPFLPERAVEDWIAHARDRVDVMLQRGLARYRNKRPNGGEENVLAWSYTWRGATQLVARHLRDLSQTTRQIDRSKKMADESIQQWRNKD